MRRTLSSVVVACCCLAAESKAFGAAELGDETVFVQQRRVAYQHLDNQREIEEAARSFFKSVKLHVSQSPESAEHGISVNREISTEPGGHVVFLLGPGCNTTDQYGTNNCTLTWSQKARLVWGVHVPFTLHPGDQAMLNLTWVLRAENISSVARRFFTGTRFLSRGVCQLCNGTCSMGLWAEDGSVALDFAVPIQLIGPGACLALRLGIPIADLPITDWTMELPPGPPTTWQLGGRGTASLALRNTSGIDVLTQSITVDLPPSDGLGLLSAAPSPASLSPSTGLVSSSVQRTQDPNGRQKSKSFLQALLAVQRASLADAAEAITSAGAAAQVRPLREDVVNAQGAKLKHLVVEYWPKTFENAQNLSGNFSLWLEPGCTTEESGCTTCRLPFGQPVSLHLSMNLDTDIEEGSSVTLTAKPKVTGLLGALFGSLVTPVETRLPLCGQESTISLGLLQFPYQPGECGHYTFGAKVPSLEFTLPDMSDLKLSDFGVAPKSLSMLPKKLVDLLGVTLRTSLLLQHSDGRPIAELEFEWGFER